MGEVRGKIILLSDVKDLGVGVSLPSQGITEHSSIEMSESYTIDQRWQDITTSLSTAASGKKEEMYINHLSSYRVDHFGTLAEAPAQLYQHFLNRTDTYLMKNKNSGGENDKKRMGVVVMDFARVSTNQLIIHLNF